MTPSSPPPLDALADRRLVMVTGKGGVGKSAVAAAIGRWLEARGRRTLIIEVDPRESVHQMLGVQPSGGEMLEVGPRLHLQNLQPRHVLDQLVSARVRIEFLARRVRRSPVYQHFAEAAPGLKELAVLGQTLLLVRGEVPDAPAFDTVVLDAPATGHGVSMLAAPTLVSEVIEHGPFGRMTSDVARFVSDPGECGVVVVTLAEEMPVTEALELSETLRRRLDREPELLVVNGLYPPWPEERPEPGGDADPGLRLWFERRRVNERELARLDRSWPGPRVELPLLALPRGPELSSTLSGLLADAPARGGGGGR